jgi:hypothetical protein
MSNVNITEVMQLRRYGSAAYNVQYRDVHGV